MSNPKIPHHSMVPHTPEITIHEHQAMLRKEEAEGLALTLEAIKASRRAGPIHVAEHSRERPGLVGPGPGNIAKCSPGGKLIGWYRVGQTRGAPSKTMPIQKEIELRTESYFKAIQALVPRSETAAILARRSAGVRRAKGKQPLIVAQWDALTTSGVRRHLRAKQISRSLDCTVAYVQRVIRNWSITTGKKT
jgi:hypothetical protein